MKPDKKIFALAVYASLFSGCAVLNPQPSQPEQPAAPQLRIVHTVTPVDPGPCGSLHEFVVDAQKLDGRQRKELLDKLGGYEEPQFSCDQLKTGMLLSQIGKTVNEDSLAIEILNQYKNSDQLGSENQKLVQLLLFQSEERKRLHVLLNKLGDQLVSQKTLSKTLSTDLLALQQKLNELQKLETDINETEQSISAPTTTNLDTTPEQDTSS